MKAHTPGPWHVSRSGIDRLVYADSEHAFDLAIVRSGGDDDEVNANARLIAAAPDLLAALKWVIDYAPTGPDAARCRAAIAAAESA